MDSGVKYKQLAGDVVLIDCMHSRPQLVGCYLLKGNDEFAFIDCGTSCSVPILLTVLEQLRVAKTQIRYVIPTHVHLDHAGGAGELMAHLPNAELLVHARGLRHMLDPTKLQQSAIQVYGETEFKRSFGALRPIAESRARAVFDGERVKLGNRVLQCLDTPGHAKHHICIYDEQTNGFFTGDTFGLAYPELDGPQGRFIMPTTTPIHFDPLAWQASLSRLLSYQPETMYLTHFGSVQGVPRLAQMLRQGIDDYVEIASTLSDGDMRQSQLSQALSDFTKKRLKEHQIKISDALLEQILTMDIQLNTQGLLYWLENR